MIEKELNSVAILGLGLLGGSVGLAINRNFPHIRRVGYSHREITRNKALELGSVDICYPNASEAVESADLVILASPIGVFPDLFRKIADFLPRGCIVTDVGSTKVLPVRWAREFLPDGACFLGSHPMAGSEQRGVEFARADLFDDAYCILTPTAKSPEKSIAVLRAFWQALGMRVSLMDPARHDRILARISHLPHVLAMSLVNCSREDEILFCGKGFLDTTRIASGAPTVWLDIMLGNAGNTSKAVGKLIKELQKVQAALEDRDERMIKKMLNAAKKKRDDLVQKKLSRRELLD